MTMTSSAQALEQVQNWMQAVIMHPDGVVAGIGSEPARRQIDVAAEEVEQVVRRSRSQSSIERLQIYANAYYARLLECLREEFPALVHALGQETFDGFAFGYLQEYPSQSYTLANLGRHFPRFLAETRPADTAGEEDGPTWPELLIDMATVERIYSEVFDGPGIEGGRILQAEDLSGIRPEQWPEARLIPVPCLRLLSLRYPVHDYVSAVRHQTEAVLPEPSPTCLVITRREYVVRRSTVSPTEYQLLKALVAGETVGRAIEHAAETAESDTLAANLHGWFRDWAAAAYFERVELPD